MFKMVHRIQPKPNPDAQKDYGLTFPNVTYIVHTSAHVKSMGPGALSETLDTRLTDYYMLLEDFSRNCLGNFGVA